MRYPTRKAIEKFNALFGISEDQYCQDWEIECADPNKILQYIDAYKSNTDDEDEKFTLMALILGSFEEYHDSKAPNPEVWDKIKEILVLDIAIHHSHIEYYQCSDESDQECIFPITPLMRKIKL